MFIPFAFVEAAANLLTNPALDPFGKIPEFKYCAAKARTRGACRAAWPRSRVGKGARTRVHCPLRERAHPRKLDCARRVQRPLS